MFLPFGILCHWRKSLQKNLTCVEIPWYPTEDKVSRRLINEEIIDQNNNPVSHFELYVESMNDVDQKNNPASHFELYVESNGIMNFTFGSSTNHILLKNLEEKI